MVRLRWLGALCRRDRNRRSPRTTRQPADVSRQRCSESFGEVGGRWGDRRNHGIGLELVVAVEPTTCRAEDAGGDAGTVVVAARKQGVRVGFLAAGGAEGGHGLTAGRSSIIVLGVSLSG